MSKNEYVIFLIVTLVVICGMKVCSQGPPIPPPIEPIVPEGINAPPVLPPPPPPVMPPGSPEDLPGPPVPMPDEQIVLPETPVQPTPSPGVGPKVPKEVDMAPIPNVQPPAETGEHVGGAMDINWTVFRSNTAHTGYTEEALRYPLKLAWKYAASMRTGDLGKANPSSPVVADGVVYFCASGRLYAVNTQTGALKWVYPAEESLPTTIKSSPLIGDDLIYFSAGDGRLYAITKDRGTLAWSFLTKGIMSSSPVLADGVVYVGSSDDHLYALDAQTGQMKWGGGFRTRDDVSCSPAVVDGLVYFMSADTVLYAVHTSTGKIKWMTRIGAISRNTHPVVSENTVYMAGGYIIQAYQAKSGRLIWSVPVRSEITTVPAVGNGTIYFGCRNGKAYAITTAGRLKWKEPVDLGAPIYGSPVLARDTVIFGADKGIIAALDAETGEIKWKYTLFPSVLGQGKLVYVNVSSSPVVSGGTLFTLTDDGVLYAFRHDFPDDSPPYVSAVVPLRGSLMPGSPPIQMGAIVKDEGSGIRYDAVAMTLDGQPVEYKVIPEKGIIWYETPVIQPAVPLADGSHIVSLSVPDWVGNRVETSWSFTVDSRLRRQPPAGPTLETATVTPGVAPAATTTSPVIRAPSAMRQ